MFGIPYRYLTEEIPGIGGRIKEELDDFTVEEVPLYPTCGKGEHVFFEVEKTDLSTLEAIRRLAKTLGRNSKDFGFAGMKDRKGITRQVLSISGVQPEALRSLSLPQIHVRWVNRHTNKLRLGQLLGNRFRVRIRDTKEAEGGRIEAILDRIRERGLPNYFGPQRFGIRGDAQWVGRALLKGEDATAVRRILGYPAVSERNPAVVHARFLFMQYRWHDALRALPPSYRQEQRLLRYLLRNGENYRGARRQIKKDILKLYYTAYQSYLFNCTLEARMEGAGSDLGRFFNGDLAFLHSNGALFRVDDAEALRERARAFEISPTGPMFGKKMLLPGPGPQQEIEARILQGDRVKGADFHQLQPRFHLAGERRAYRVKAEDVEWRREGRDIVMKFFLPRGSYATTLLRELMKNEQVTPGFLEQ